MPTHSAETIAASWRACARGCVQRRARETSRNRVALRNARSEIRQTERRQLAIGIDVVAELVAERLADRNRLREPDQRHRQRQRQHLPNVRPVHGRHGSGAASRPRRDPARSLREHPVPRHKRAAVQTMTRASAPGAVGAQRFTAHRATMHPTAIATVIGVRLAGVREHVGHGLIQLRVLQLADAEDVLAADRER